MEPPSVSGFGNAGFGVEDFGTAWIDPCIPNLTDFTNFVYSNAEVPEAALPLGSPWLSYAFNKAMALVYFVPQVAALEYVWAVYNCGTHILFKITPDQPGQTFFKDTRKDWKLLQIEIGVIQSSSDEGTSQSFAIGDGMKNMTIGDLNFYKSPYGREYLAYAQDAGPNIWGDRKSVV